MSRGLGDVYKRQTADDCLHPFHPFDILGGRMGYELQDNAGIGLALRLFHRLGRHDSYRSIDLAIYETKGLVLKPILTI